MTSFLQRLEKIPLASSIAGSDWAFPVIETAHVIAVALLVGTVSVLDLRLLLWASAKRPYAQVTHEVLPWTWTAFGFAILSGALMFITQASEYFSNMAFRIKMLLLVAAGINMLIFELITARAASTWDNGTEIPWAAKTAAGLSLILWIAIVLFGRRIGFTMVPG